jgi:hypothetical protein
MVYERNPHTVDELKEYISEAFIEIDADRDFCRAVCRCLIKKKQKTFF